MTPFADAAVLSRTRRRRPPQARLVWTLLMTAVCLLWLGRGVLVYALTHDALTAGFPCLCFTLAFANWRREYLRTRRSEEENRRLRPVSRFEWGLLTTFYFCLLW